MASAIDATQPTTGNTTTAAMRANMIAAKAEIEALQAAAALYSMTLSKTTDQAIVKGNVSTKINFDAVAHAFGGLTLWEIGSPSRFTIPAGFTAAKLLSQVRLTDAFAGQAYTNHIYKNGSLNYVGVALPGDSVPTAGALVLPSATPWLPVVAGDYFETGIINTDPATDNWVLGSVRTWFAIELRK